MAKGFVGEVSRLTYDTDGTQTGLTDLEFDVYLPNGTADAGNPFAASEIASTGVYAANYTPTVKGDHILIASSATSSPVIANKAGMLQVEEHSSADLAGATFDPSTDSQEAIRDALTTLGAASANGRVL